MATTESTTENTAPQVTTEAPATETPAKKAPAKRSPRKPSAKKTPAKKAPAKKAAAKKGDGATQQGRKVRWTETQEFKNGKNQHGVGLGGVKFTIVRAPDGEFAAKVTTPKGVSTNLVKGTFSAAYWACVNYNKANVEKADARAAKKTAGEKVPA